MAILVNFFQTNCRLKYLACFFIVFANHLYFSQTASIFENITESDGLPSNYVFNVVEDQNSTIWLGTDKGLVTYKDGSWIALDVDNGMPGNYINKAVADKKNGLLLCISEKGLYYFNTNTYTLMKRYAEVDEKIVLNIQRANINGEYIIVHTKAQRSNKVQFYAFNRGNIYQLAELNVIRHNKENLLQLKNGTVISNMKIFENLPIDYSNDYSLLKSESGIGILRFAKGKLIDTLTERNGLTNNTVSHILKRSNGDVYISTLGGGLSVLKKNNSKISFYNKVTNARGVIYRNGKKYILADGYLYIVGDKSIEKKIFLRKDAMSFEVSGNNLLVGSFEGLHFYELSPKIKLIKTYPITVGISKIISIKDKIVFSTYGQGIVVLHGNNKETIRNQYFNNIEDLFKIKHGYAITSYESGTTILDEDFRVVTHLDKKNGLESNYSTYAFSDNDTIYVGTKKGVTLFVDGNPVLSLNNKNGYDGNITKSIFRDHNKQIWVLTDKCLMKKSRNSLKPLGSIRLIENNNDQIIKGTYSPLLNNLTVITKNKFAEVDINKIVPNNKPYPIILDKIVSNNKIISERNNIKFEDHNQNIYFVFRSVDKEVLTRSKLFYKINNGIWKPFVQPRAVKFSHLERGNYKLFIKNVNADGYESFLEQPIRFKVLGPFYIRWWFILISAFFASFFIYNYVNEQNKKRYVKRLNALRVKNQIDSERKRIGRDLHDNIGAYVTSLISKIDLLKNSVTNEASESKFEDVRLDAEHILALLRQTIYVLANKETTLIALYDNFKSYALKFLQTDNIRIIFEENVENNRKLDPSISSGIFRIMQEALQNIYKHANATMVEINVISKDKIIIFIKDNGKGFKEGELNFGYGIKNMKERALEIGFKFNIYSDVTGTTIELVEI